MSTDKELLTLAAKAAGISGGFDGLTGCFIPDDGFIPASHQFYWNPLKSDGDALRLAVKLKMDVFGCHEIRYTETNSAVFQEEVINNDPYAATRRAIVRAAATIGKEMK